jgi:hypothetical protein
MPAAPTVEELAPARTRQPQDVLDVRQRGGERAESRGIEGAAPCDEKTQADEPASDLEAPRRDVPVRDPVAREVEKRPEQERRPSGTRGSAGQSAGRDVKRSDQSSP